MCILFSWNGQEVFKSFLCMCYISCSVVSSSGPHNGNSSTYSRYFAVPQQLLQVNIMKSLGDQQARWQCSFFSFFQNLKSIVFYVFGILVQRVGIPSEEVIWHTPWHGRLWSSCNWPQCHAASSVSFAVQVFRARLWGITQTASSAVL